MASSRCNTCHRGRPQQYTYIRASENAKQIAGEVIRATGPHDAMIAAEAVHLCMTVRDARSLPLTAVAVNREAFISQGEVYNITGPY
ncbi:MAG: hypothetical protein ABWW69_00915, partial [Pyrodictiaceae archaeon]